MTMGIAFLLSDYAVLVADGRRRYRSATPQIACDDISKVCLLPGNSGMIQAGVAAASEALFRRLKNADMPAEAAGRSDAYSDAMVSAWHDCELAHPEADFTDPRHQLALLAGGIDATGRPYIAGGLLRAGVRAPHVEMSTRMDIPFVLGSEDDDAVRQEIYTAAINSLYLSPETQVENCLQVAADLISKCALSKPDVGGTIRSLVFKAGERPETKVLKQCAGAYCSSNCQLH